MSADVEFFGRDLNEALDRVIRREMRLSEGDAFNSDTSTFGCSLLYWAISDLKASPSVS